MSKNSIVTKIMIWVTLSSILFAWCTAACAEYIPENVWWRVPLFLTVIFVVLMSIASLGVYLIGGD